MKWYRHLKRPPEPNDRRERRMFLVWPKEIAGESRWLEYAVWEEQLMEITNSLSYTREPYLRWRAVRWVN